MNAIGKIMAKAAGKKTVEILKCPWILKISKILVTRRCVHHQVFSGFIFL